MRGLLFVIGSFAVTVLAWGIYGPVLHEGQAAMAGETMKYARLRPFVCVGLAYFLIGVVVPAVILWTKGEQGRWTISGGLMSLFAGALGAIGALGIIMAFNFGGKPSYVMPLVFGGAPVVNSFLTIYLAGKLKEIGPLFLTGLIMVLLGSVTVLTFAPKAKPKAAAHDPASQTAAADSDGTLDAISGPKQAGGIGSFSLQLLSIATVVCCWGAYGPTLHKGQMAMQQSRLRPLLCVGLAYFAIAVVVPYLLFGFGFTEDSSYTFSGTIWSLAAGAAGAVGALGIIMAFNFGGKPIYVMPLVFGGAPVVNTLTTASFSGAFSNIEPVYFALFLAGLILTICGAAMVLVFAPKGHPPKKQEAAPTAETEPAKPTEAPSAEAPAADTPEPPPASADA